MSDRRPEIGDRVKFKLDTGLTGEGDIITVEPSNLTVLIRVNAYMTVWANWANLTYEEDEAEPEKLHNYHECAPYVGIQHVDRQCVYCGRHMVESEVAKYILEKALA